jgi:hypothetical protein
MTLYPTYAIMSKNYLCTHAYVYAEVERMRGYNEFEQGAE